MSKWSVSLFCLAGLLASSPLLHAQASPTATRGGGTLQVGAGILILDPGYYNYYGSHHDYGVTAYAGYDFYRFLGVEADLNFGGIKASGDIAENSYMIGPRATYHRGKAAVYGKFLVGRGTIRNQQTEGASTFNAYAFGGGLEYRVKPHYNIRVVDVAVQQWPDFEPKTLSPVTITVGVSYVFR